MRNTKEVIQQVLEERTRQNDKWGYPQDNTPFEWMSILTEEVGELAQALNDSLMGKVPSGDLSKVEHEAIQVAAVAISVVEHLMDGGVQVYHQGGILPSDNTPFDGNRILTVMTGNKSYVGMRGWFADTPRNLQLAMCLSGPTELVGFHPDKETPFVSSNGHQSILFYPVEGQDGIPLINQYRPYNNNELNSLVGEVVTNRFSGRRKLVTGRPKQRNQVNLDGRPFTSKQLLEHYYRNGDEVCGVLRDASDIAYVPQHVYCKCSVGDDDA
jgi:NTP pyrophosphatase (non-canonical NTP hydrolase)